MPVSTALIIGYYEEMVSLRDANSGKCVRRIFCWIVRRAQFVLRALAGQLISECILCVFLLAIQGLDVVVSMIAKAHILSACLKCTPPFASFLPLSSEACEGYPLPC